MERQGIVSNCPLCEDLENVDSTLYKGFEKFKVLDDKRIELSQDQELNFMQCVNCGYVSSDKFLGTKEDNEEYKKLDELLQSWVKETEGRLWIPIQMTLPFGMIYPALVENEMKWIFAETQEIPEEERKNYPIEGQEGKFYDKKYNTENPKMYEIYAEALADVQSIIQRETQKAAQSTGLKLPKLSRK